MVHALVALRGVFSAISSLTRIRLTLLELVGLEATVAILRRTTPADDNTRCCKTGVDKVEGWGGKLMDGCGTASDGDIEISLFSAERLRIDLGAGDGDGTVVATLQLATFATEGDLLGTNGDGGTDRQLAAFAREGDLLGTTGDGGTDTLDNILAAVDESSVKVALRPSLRYETWG